MKLIPIVGLSFKNKNEYSFPYSFLFLIVYFVEVVPGGTSRTRTVLEIEVLLPSTSEYPGTRWLRTYQVPLQLIVDYIALLI